MPAALSTTKVHGGADSFKKILANVVDNAVRYNKVNGSVSVAASLEQTGESSAELKCTVRDTGIGMSPETVERVSEPFFQADEGARSQYPGSGLGMSIVADLLRLLNGSFDISSTPGKGTVVCISVPLTVVATNCEPEQQPAATDDIAGMRILLVEDNELNREVTQSILQYMGAEVSVACDGREAVHVFESSEEGSFDAILMDIMMPVMDGIEAAKAIRALHRSDSNVPILATTAKVTEEDRRDVLAAGMNAHLTKPLDPEQLRASLASFRE